jgi:hypothetical protein
LDFVLKFRKELFIDFDDANLFRSLVFFIENASSTLFLSFVIFSQQDNNIIVNPEGLVKMRCLVNTISIVEK